MRGLATCYLFFLTILCYSQVDIGQIPDQTIGQGGQFENITLGDFSYSSSVFWEASFLNPAFPENDPVWSFSASDFQFQMNITATVLSKGKKAIGDSHQLAVLDNQQAIRGIASAISVGGDWVYFMTVYSNSNDETLFFRFFDDSIKQSLNGKQSFTFSSNQIIGEPDEPLIIEAANFEINLSGNTLDMSIQDQSYVGAEQVCIMARSLTNPNDFDADTLTFTVIDDFVPILSGISDQITGFEEPFSSFDLDDFTTLLDIDPVNFSFSSNDELEVAIDKDNIATITKPDSWSGADTITFTVTDISDNSFSSSQQVIFKGKFTDQVPIITHIEDQVTGLQGIFETLDLSTLITASNPKNIIWDFNVITDSAMATPDWAVNAKEFQFNMSATIEASSMGKILTGNQHIIAAFSEKNNALIGSANAIAVNSGWYYFLTIYNNDSKDSVYFKVYDQNTKRILPTNQYLTFSANDVVGDPLSPFSINAGYFFPSLDENKLSFSIRPSNWKGTEILKISATDTQTDQLLSDKDTINFIVLDTQPPTLANIENKTIREGNVFKSIELTEILSNILPEEVTWSIQGADTLKPSLKNSLLSFNLPSEHYFGTETITIKATSNANSSLFDLITFQLTTVNINDEPVITTTPSGEGKIDEIYQYNFRAIDYDNDELTIEVINLPAWLYSVPEQSQLTILGIPSSENAGLSSFSIKVKDGITTTTQNVSIAISFAKMETIPAQTVNEGQNFAPISLSDYVTIFGDLAVTWEASAENELTVEVINNVLQVASPDDNWYGQENISVTMTTSNNNVYSQNVTYTVNNLNDAPTITSSPVTSAKVNVEYRYDLVANDIDNPDLTVSIDNPLPWLTFIESKSGGAFIGTPLPEHAGAHSFVIGVADQETFVSQTVDIFVSYAAFSTIEDQTIEEGSAFDQLDLNSFLTVFGNINTYWAVSGQSELNAAINSANELIVTTPNTDWFGTEVLTIQLLDLTDDAVLDQQVINFIVKNVNDAPVINSTPTASAKVNVEYRYDLVANDIDNPDLTVSIDNPLPWLTFIESKSGGAFIGTPLPEHAGAHSFVIDVADQETFIKQTVEIFVSYAAFSTIEGQTIEEGSSFVDTELNDFLTVFGDITTYWKVSGQSELSVELVDGHTLSLATPNTDWFGNESLTLQLIDQVDDALLDEQIVIYTVNNVNDAPVITSIPSSTAAVGKAYSYSITTQDIDRDQLTIKVTNLPSWLTFVLGENGGTILGTPSANHAGSNQFQISLTDNMETVTQEVDILVAAANFMTIADQAVDEGASFSAIALNDFLQVFGDINVAWSITGGNELAASIDNNNALTVAIPNADWFGSESFTLSLIDLNTSNIVDQQTIKYAVNNVNDAPSFTKSLAETVLPNLNYSKTISISDIDQDVLTYQVDIQSDWLTVIAENNQILIFGTSPNRADTISFTVEVSDGTIAKEFSGQIIVDFVLSSTLEFEEFNVFPNPSKDFVYISERAGISAYTIYDMNGSRIRYARYNGDPIDIRFLPEGKYLFIFDNDQESKAIRMIKE